MHFNYGQSKCECISVQDINKHGKLWYGSKTIDLGPRRMRFVSLTVHPLWPRINIRYIWGLVGPQKRSCPCEGQETLLQLPKLEPRQSSSSQSLYRLNYPRSKPRTRCQVGISATANCQLSTGLPSTGHTYISTLCSLPRRMLCWAWILLLISVIRSDA
jgi:hypothetical protein